MLTKDTMIKTVFSQALDSLLEEKELEDIHTSEIISKSGFSKSTFYRYFQDKFELANWHLKSVLDDLNMQLTGPEEQESNLKDIFKAIYAKRTVYQKLFKYTGQNSVMDYYLDIGFNTAQEGLSRNGKELTKRDKYVILYHSEAIMTLISQWVADPNPLSLDEFTDIVLANRSDEIKKLFTIQFSPK